ncbi:hypothetical protein D3C87_1169450 [compost metagenome]
MASPRGIEGHAIVLQLLDRTAVGDHEVGAEHLDVVDVARAAIEVGCQEARDVGIPEGRVVCQPVNATVAMGVDVHGRAREGEPHWVVQARERLRHRPVRIVEAYVTRRLVAAYRDLAPGQAQPHRIQNIRDLLGEGAVRVVDDQAPVPVGSHPIRDPDPTIRGHRDVAGILHAHRIVRDDPDRIAPRRTEPLQPEEGLLAVLVALDQVVLPVVRSTRLILSDGDHPAHQGLVSTVRTPVQIGEIEGVNLAMRPHSTGVLSQIDRVVLDGGIGVVIAVEALEDLDARAVGPDLGQSIEATLVDVEVAGRIPDETSGVGEPLGVDRQLLLGIDPEDPSLLGQGENPLGIRPGGYRVAQAEPDLTAFGQRVDPVDAVADVVGDIEIARRVRVHPTRRRNACKRRQRPVGQRGHPRRRRHRHGEDRVARVVADVEAALVVEGQTPRGAQAPDVLDCGARRRRTQLDRKDVVRTRVGQVELPVGPEGNPPRLVQGGSRHGHFRHCTPLRRDDVELVLDGVRQVQRPRGNPKGDPRRIGDPARPVVDRRGKRGGRDVVLVDLPVGPAGRDVEEVVTTRTEGQGSGIVQARDQGPNARLVGTQEPLDDGDRPQPLVDRIDVARRIDHTVAVPGRQAKRGTGQGLVADLQEEVPVDGRRRNRHRQARQIGAHRLGRRRNRPPAVRLEEDLVVHRRRSEVAADQLDIIQRHLSVR